MNAHRFDLLVAWVLLLIACGYGLQMLSYSNNAGRVPAICAAVMAGALVVQLAMSHRHRTTGGKAGRAATESAAVGPTVGEDSTDYVAGANQLAARYEPEPDSYETLIALHGVRRRRFLSIALFSCLFYLGFALVGFVLTTGLLIAGILLAAREKIYVATTGGVVGAAVAYTLVVTLIGVEPLQGLLIP